MEDDSFFNTRFKDRPAPVKKYPNRNHSEIRVITIGKVFVEVVSEIAAYELFFE
jgi:hypothetical protein